MKRKSTTNSEVILNINLGDLERLGIAVHIADEKLVFCVEGESDFELEEAYGRLAEVLTMRLGEAVTHDMVSEFKRMVTSKIVCERLAGLMQ